MNESEESEEIKTLPLYHYLLQRQQTLPDYQLISVGRPHDARYMYTTPLPHPTTRTISRTGITMFKFS